MRRALIMCRSTPINDALSRAPVDLRPGDAALGRLDVLPTLDGMNDGLLARRGGVSRRSGG